MKRLCIGTGIVLAMVLLFTPLAGASISINIQVRPQLVLLPGVPVYYAPELPYNFFFYAGRYYVFIDGVWYVGPTYRGPWVFLPLVGVPQPILLVPVEYYRVPIPGWHRGGPPPWARHRVEFREREERARREFERERREHREGRLEERGEREIPPAAQPDRRQHRESRLPERREPQGQEHQQLKRERPERQGQAPPAVQPPQPGRREQQEGRLQEHSQHEGKGPRGPVGEAKGHEGKGPRGPERGGGEHSEGSREEHR